MDIFAGDLGSGGSIVGGVGHLASVWVNAARRLLYPNVVSRPAVFSCIDHPQLHRARHDERGRMHSDRTQQIKFNKHSIMTRPVRESPHAGTTTSVRFRR